MSITKSGTLKAAKDLLEQHKKNAGTTSRAENLDRLWMVLEEMRVAGATKFDLATIGKKLKIVDGIKTQSIRNASGLPYREVIALYSSAFERPASDPGLEEAERALSTVTNISAKHFFRGQAMQVRKLTAECQKLRVTISTLSTPAIVSPQPSVPHAQLPAWALDAIEHNLAPSWLSERGLKMSSEGGLRDTQDTCLLEPSFLAAMDELLRACGREGLAESKLL